MGRAWALVLIAACSPSVADLSDAASGPADGAAPDPNDGAKSGSRLKLTWYAFTDGTRQWSGMYDAQNKQLCSPYYAAWTNGSVYCVPPAGGSLVYTNSACTTRAVHYYTGTCAEAVQPYYVEYATVGCTSAPAHLYRRGAQVAPATTYTKLSNGTCASNGSPSSGDAIYALDAEVPTSQLVELSLTAPEGSGRLGIRYYTSSDGMRFPWTLHDSTLGGDCSASYASDASPAARCVPNQASYASYAHDASCTQPELALQSTCPAPQYGYTFPATSCPDDAESYYQVSGTAAASPLYFPAGASCLATSASSGYSYYTLGAEVEVAPLTRAVDSGTAHRVQLAHYTADDGLRYRDPYALYDSQMGTRCYPTTLPDGSIRCIASGGYIDTYYSNAGCSTPIDLAEVYRGPASCSAPVPPAYARKSIAPQPGTCTYSTEVHQVTTVHSGPVYSGSPGSCTVYTPYEGILYNVGPVVPLTDFVAAAIAIDN